MLIFLGIVISLSIILISLYLTFVLTGLVISEDFGERITLKVAFVLPIYLVNISLKIAFNNFKTNKKLALTSIKMATVDYAVITTMFIATIKDHQAQIELYGESIYTERSKEVDDIVIRKKEKNKSWLKSIPNIKAFLSSPEFKDYFTNNLATS